MGQKYIQRYCSIDLAQQFFDDLVIKKDLEEDPLYDAFDVYDELVKEKSDGWLLTGFSVNAYKRHDGTHEGW